MARRNRRRVPTVDPCRALEPRRLLSAVATAPPRAPSLFIEPTAGPAPILRAIDSARHQIRLGICNITDPAIGDAMIAAAERGVRVRMIVDHAEYEKNPAEQQLVAEMVAGGVSVHLSNPIFPQSFEKELVIDRRRVLIMTMCLEPATFEDTRDDGLVLASPAIIGEVARFFDNDWSHSAAPGVTPPPDNPTPPIRVPDLIWSPVNATAALTSLIRSARHTIDATTELLDDPRLEGALIAAARRGVRVRLILPMDPRNGSSNRAGIDRLSGNGVQVRVTIGQYPPTGAMPYMHAKTMIVDGRIAYLGSIDLVTTQTTEDRELGILFRRPGFIRRLARQFRSDWAASATLAEAEGSPAFNTGRS